MIEPGGDGWIPFSTHRLGIGEALPCPLYRRGGDRPYRWHEAGDLITAATLAEVAEPHVFIESRSLGGFAGFLTGRMERALEDPNTAAEECGLRVYDAGWAVLSDYFGRPEVVEARAKVSRLARAMTMARLKRGVLAAVLSTPAGPNPGVHGVRVAAIALLIAHARGLGDASSERLSEGALIHDLGEAVMPTRDAELDASSWTEAARAQHPSVGFGLLRAHGDVDPMVTACVLAHHERLDGRGVPYGLSGTAIPLAGRIVGLADALDEFQWAHPTASMTTCLANLVQSEPNGFDSTLVEALSRTLQG